MPERSVKSTRSTTSASPPAPAPRHRTCSSTSPSGSPPPSYAGIDVERNGLLSGTRGEQIAGRFGMVRTSAFPRGQYWTGLISALEGSLRLHRHQPGALAGLEEYLHRRTGGMIGSLLRLIRGAAVQAVLDGTEKITRSALDSIGVDIASETAGP
ncbi:MAG TPA: hypothetical protein VHZ03_12615 [Trebonia sp.]|nr:hypothetical protein [Trebonia sp.]